MKFDTNKEYCIYTANNNDEIVKRKTPIKLGKFKKNNVFYTSQGPIEEYQFDNGDIPEESTEFKHITECNNVTELKHEENDMILDCDVTENINNKMKLNCKESKKLGGGETQIEPKIPEKEIFFKLCVVQKLFIYAHCVPHSWRLVFVIFRAVIHCTGDLVGFCFTE